MNVIVLTHGQYDDMIVIGVFSDKLHAKEYVHQCVEDQIDKEMTHWKYGNEYFTRNYGQYNEAKRSVMEKYIPYVREEFDYIEFEIDKVP